VIRNPIRIFHGDLCRSKVTNLRGCAAQSLNLGHSTLQSPERSTVADWLDRATTQGLYMPVSHISSAHSVEMGQYIDTVLSHEIPTFSIYRDTKNVATGGMSVSNGWPYIPQN